MRAVGQVQSVGPEVRELAAVEGNPGGVGHPNVALDPLVEVGRVDWAEESRAGSAAALILDKTLLGEPRRVLEGAVGSNGLGQGRGNQQARPKPTVAGLTCRER